MYALSSQGPYFIAMLTKEAGLRENAFTVMMAAARSRKFPPLSSRTDNRSKMMNDVVAILKAEGAGFTSNSLASGKNFHSVLCDILWKVRCNFIRV